MQPSSAGRVPERVLDAAVALMAEGGIAAVNQGRIARAAGIRQSHLTYYFPRKADLLLAVGRRALDQLTGELGELFTGTGWPGADTDLRRRVARALGRIVKDRGRTRMMLTLVTMAEDDPQLREALWGHVRGVRALLARGMGRAADDPEVGLRLATLWGLGLQHLLAGDGEGFTDELLDRLLFGGKESR